jgi:hypothetical protein
MPEEEIVDTGQMSGIGLKRRMNPSCLGATNPRIFAIRKMEETENAVVIGISNSRFAIRKWARDGAGSDPMAGLATKRARCSSTFRVPQEIRNAAMGAKCKECPDNAL